jgi:hypothetical protein
VLGTLGPVSVGWRLSIVVLSALVLVGASGDSTPGGVRRSPVGTWETGPWERQSGRVLDDIPETLQAERWTIERARRCQRPIRHCALDVVNEALEGAPTPLELLLQPAEPGVWAGALDFVSSCVDLATGAVKEDRASDVVASYEVEVSGQGRDRRLDLRSIWDAEPTEEGIAAGCRIESARFETTARLAEAR